MTAHTYHFARISEPADAKWGGGRGEIPKLTLADTEIYLQDLGADLGPWLLALSDRLVEFAETVAPDGTRLIRPERTTAELTAEMNALTESERPAKLERGLGRWA